jgi:diaminopimelate epimerase
MSFLTKFFNKIGGAFDSRSLYEDFREIVEKNKSTNVNSGKNANTVSLNSRSKIQLHDWISKNEENIRLICHRNYGIGSDGILFGPIIKNGKISFQIFNPDGSEAEKSGNGIRIFALYVHDQEYIKENQFELYTKGGMVGIYILDLKSNLIRGAMGEYSFLSEKIPMNLVSQVI